MPYVLIKVTKEDGPSAEQKRRLIAGVTQLLVDVLDKDPNHTFVLIDEVSVENWGVGGITTKEYRANAALRHRRSVD